MAVIQSGDSAALQTIDPLSKAARVTLYSPDGSPTIPTANTGRGIAGVAVRQSTVAAIGAVVWAMRNPHPTRKLFITNIWLMTAFDGAVAATLMKYELVKGTSCSAITNGVPVVPMIKSAVIGQSPDAEVKVLDTGLTLSGVAHGGVGLTFAGPRQATNPTGSGRVLNFVFPIELSQNEVLSLRTAAVSVVGDGLLGGIEFQNG